MLCGCGLLEAGGKAKLDDHLDQRIQEQLASAVDTSIANAVKSKLPHALAALAATSLGLAGHSKWKLYLEKKNGNGHNGSKP